MTDSIPLHIDVIGEGPDIVFFHGWGMNSEVWQQTVDALSENYRLTLIDFPGFGKNRKVDSDFQLDTLTDCVFPHVSKGAIIVAWSMGGLVAMNIALKYPAQLSKLVLISSSAQFSAAADWPFAMKSEVLSGFVDNLSKNFKQTLQRFLMLQARGGDNAKETIRELKERLYKHGEPSEKALEGGLQLLKNISFIDKIEKIKLPVLLMFGKLDTLVPIGAAQEMARRFPNNTLVVFPKSAHAPFISHFDEYISALKDFASTRNEK